MKNKVKYLGLLLPCLLVSCANFGYINPLGPLTSSSDSSTDTSSSSEDTSSTSDSSSGQQVEYIDAQENAKSLNYTYMDYSDNSPYGTSVCPCVGDAKILVIPIWFTDSSNYITTAKKNYVKQDIQKAYFGTKAETGWHSVKTFYEEESNGALTLDGTVSDWYECGYSSSTFYTEDEGADYTSSLVSDATNWYFQNNSSDVRTNYDKDEDGYLDAVMLIYGSPDYSTLGNRYAGNMWAYCYWLAKDNAFKLSPNPNVYFWASYDFMYGSSVVSSRTGKSYYGGDTSHCSIDTHTYIHEMGHVFGLDDYYDYSGQYSPAGGFSMQDNNVGGHDPYSVLALGWGKVFVPTETCKVKLSSFQENHVAIVLPTTTAEFKCPFDEYLLLELYTPTGLNKLDCDYIYDGHYPQGPKKTGIRLWHVDARLTCYTNNGWSTTLYNNFLHSYTNHAMTNTYYDGENEDDGYLSLLGVDYSDYNLLQLIRNNKLETYRPLNDLRANDLFTSGSSFSISQFSKQFVNGTKMNNANRTMRWSFSVDNISGSDAYITLTKD